MKDNISETTVEGYLILVIKRREYDMVATIEFVKKAVAEIKKSAEKLFQGEITIGKKECWLIGIILLLAGITIGLLNAPLTHGVNLSLFSHNWSNNGNDNGNNNSADMDVDELCKPIAKKDEKEKANDSKSSCTCKKKKKWITC